MNNINSSFSSFCSSNGIETLLKVIQAQVDFCIVQFSNNEIQNPDSLSLVKNTLRFLIRMMESTDTAEGLRNLVESSIPHTIKKVLENANVFGPSVFALVVNVTTTFIHNEPTSLSVIQEIQVPQTFLKVFNSYDTPSFEVLLSAVHAFGAICLNTPGLDMFKESNPLPHFFELLTAPSFVSNTYDVGNAPALGTTMDELIRHHPSLKVQVFEFANDLMLKVVQVGNSVEGQPLDNRHQLMTEEIIATTEKTDCLVLGYVDLVSRVSLL
jgi:E3 ubiquitin-protein ligase HUWE1